MVVHPDSSSPQLCHRCMGGTDDPREPLTLAPTGPALGRGSRLGGNPVGPGGPAIPRRGARRAPGTPGNGPNGYGFTYGPATLLDRNSDRARLAPSGEFLVQGMPAHRPQ